METLTLLFSDIEGSTRLLAALGNRYDAVVADHAALLRKAFTAHGGDEQTTEGDSFFVTFPSAASALAAAVDMQLALAAWDGPAEATPRVRIGLHAGEVRGARGELVGMAIHEAARIAAAGHGGQVVLSGVVRDLVGSDLPSGVSFRSLGRHVLRDVSRPLELLQICHPELADRFPPLRTLDVPTNLPVSRTSFVGRVDELERLTDLLAAHRLVTLTGVGGAGKTRLAVEAAGRALGRFPDGVFYVDLAPVRDPDAVMSAIGAALNVQGESGQVDRVVAESVGPRDALIVLDTCEHLIDSCAEAVDVLLTQGRRLRVLATSREPLDLDGEHTMQVRSLPVGGDDDAAISLFEQRARAAQSGFRVTAANHGHVKTICERLDGMPLAIELAAARVATMGVDELSRRLDDRFELLTGSRRGRSQRQQTLQATMEWSWKLLSDNERRTLRWLAVYAGSFTLDGAAGLIGRDAFGAVTSLVARSLVSTEETIWGTRYRLLETVRAYAQQQLVDAGEAEAARNALVTWYAETSAATTVLLTFDELGRRLHAEYPNLRAALEWADSTDAYEALGRIVANNSDVFWMGGSSLPHVQEGMQWATRVAEDERQPLEIRAAALSQLGFLAIMNGDLPTGRAAFEAALELDAAEGWWTVMACVFTARFDEAHALADRIEIPDIRLSIAVWSGVGGLGFDPEASQRALRALRAEIEASPLHDRWEYFFCLAGLAFTALLLQDPTAALTSARRVREVFGPSAPWGGIVLRYGELLEAMALALTDEVNEARSRLEDFTTMVLRERYPLFQIDCLAAWAWFAFCEGDLDEAARRLEPVLADGRVRTNGMQAFAGRLAANLNAAFEARGDAAPLDVRAYLALWIARVRGDAVVAPNPELDERIERQLRELTSEAGRGSSDP